MTNEVLAQISEESIQQITTRKHENLEAALRALTGDGIEEPEYDVIFDIYCETCGDDGKEYTCGGRYYYDKNGILRKLHRHGIDFMVRGLEQPGVSTDCFVYDDRGRMVRALYRGNSSGRGSIFFDFAAFGYKLDDPDRTPFWGMKEILKLIRDNEGGILIKEACCTHVAEVSEFYPKTPELSWWCDPEKRTQQEHRSKYYDCSEPFGKEIFAYKIHKASAEQRENLMCCFRERLAKSFEEDDEEM